MATLRPGSGFFRPDSRPARDLSVLLAASTLEGASRERPLRWLDLMAGCGIRSLRWALEARGASHQPVELWVNDADQERGPLLAANLEPLHACDGVVLNQIHQPAERLLREAYLEHRFFDLIDIDPFGCPNVLLQSTLQAMRFGGVLLLASTDGRSPTGHDRFAAVRRFGAAARAHPSSWELALRLQLAAVAREAWLLGRGLEPLFSFSDGRTFRVAVRMRQRIRSGEEQQLGFVARCERCGDQAVQAMLDLQGWRPCACTDGCGRWAVSGPLWIGPIQNVSAINGLLEISDRLDAGFNAGVSAGLSEGRDQTLAPRSRRMLEGLLADPGQPACCWSTAELSRRFQLKGPPAIEPLVAALRASGYGACVSGVMAGQVRTNAPLGILLRRCAEFGGKDR
ncbi:N2,N2-dimethylguanosine tRNA methyltransferase [Synechococcus sp. WH 8016]|uniref:N2,N2-dimethylguanosine tRNA methyltransferase n=1 Tax=Synechococcus sp. WH 8016 TaxID=166318 RepID=UPI00022D8D7F|nr:N2N2-dimethylguanosine tRNA methyltransferase [Synechococcus sp. WH 8016]